MINLFGGAESRVIGAVFVAVFTVLSTADVGRGMQPPSVLGCAFCEQVDAAPDGCWFRVGISQYTARD